MPCPMAFLQLFGAALLCAGYFWGNARSSEDGADAPRTASNQPIAVDVDRSPVDVVLTADEQWLLTANQTANSVSLVRVADGKTTSELRVGQRPSALAITPDKKQVLVTCTYSGELTTLQIDGEQLRIAGTTRVGFEPRGVAISPDGRLAYVALTTANAVAVVDLSQHAVTRRIPVGRWPRYLALSPDGSRLAVGVNGDRGVSVVDTIAGKMLYQEEFSGINLGQMQVSPDGKYVYFPWMVYRQNPITQRNIQLGWVLGTRIARVRLDGPAEREAITLDPRGEAVADPHGMGLTPDGQWLVSAASGTHELLVYRLPDIPWQGYGGPGDHIDPKLQFDKQKHFRIPLTGRPMALSVSRDSRHVYVSNYLNNSVQVVDLQERRVARTIELGGPASPSLARRGEAIFYDGGRSLDQWYSCHSCHYEGGTNAVAMDTMNDGSVRTFKTVLRLHNVTKTGPWTWHGWQQDIDAAMRKSMKDTMLGKAPTDEDVEALVAFFDTLAAPPSSYRNADGSLTAAAARGQLVFQSEKAGCSNCHTGPLFTDGLIHDVGLGSANDVYQGFNTPSLLGVSSQILFLHNGRAKSLEDVLTGLHNPANVTGRGELSDDERRDLIEYLKSL